MLFLPLLVSAEVYFSDDTNVYLSGKNLTLVIKAGSTIDEMTVYPTYISFNLMDGSSATVQSSDKLVLRTSPTYFATECRADYSQVRLFSSISQTVTLTPQDKTCTGAPAFLPPRLPLVEEEVVPEKPIIEMTIEELKAKIAEILVKIAELRALLIQLLQERIAELQEKITQLRTQLRTQLP